MRPFSRHSTLELISCLDDEMGDERRKFTRFKTKEGAFAAFIKPNELVNMGQIQDISMGGLCVRYLAANDWDGECTEIKIFGTNNQFIHLDKIQCRIAYDLEIPERSWEQISTRRCGVEFQSLSVKHFSLLEEFIEHFAVP